MHPPQAMVSLFFILTFTLTLAQKMNAVTLCPSANSNDITPSSFSGIIEHKKLSNDSDDAWCSLKLTGFTSGTKISLPGVKRVEGECLVTVEINGAAFCVDPDNLETVVEISTDGTLTLALRKSVGDFVIEYYTVTSFMGEITKVSVVETDISGLSGVLSSIGYPQEQDIMDDQYLKLNNLPIGSVIRFTPFKAATSALTFGTVRIGLSDVNIKAASSSLLLANNKDMQSGVFLIKYQVLTCGELPDYQGSTHSTPERPWYAGLNTTVEYQCSPGFQGPSSSTIKCVVGNTGLAEWTTLPTHQQCHPVHCYKSRLPSVTNAHTKTAVTMTQFNYADKIEYSCYDGYSMDGDDYVQCIGENNWSEPPTCVKDPVKDEVADKPALYKDKTDQSSQIDGDKSKAASSEGSSNVFNVDSNTFNYIIIASGAAAGLLIAVLLIVCVTLYKKEKFIFGRKKEKFEKIDRKLSRTPPEEMSPFPPRTLTRTMGKESYCPSNASSEYIRSEQQRFIDNRRPMYPQTGFNNNGPYTDL